MNEPNEDEYEYKGVKYLAVTIEGTSCGGCGGCSFFDSCTGAHPCTPQTRPNELHVRFIRADDLRSQIRKARNEHTNRVQ